MKKLFIVLAVASLGFVACNNSSDSETKNEDSANKANKEIDSTAKAAKDAMDSTANAAKDAIDSTGKAAKDTVKSKM
jgi:hypothetical protein